MQPALLDDLIAFAEHFGIELYPWQADAFGQACARESGRFKYRLAGISVPRGVGKSLGGSVVGLWRLLAGPAPQDILSAALDYDGAKVILDHAKKIIRANKALAKAIDVQAGRLVVKSTGSRWRITSREHQASRGIHPTLVLYDEVGWARDDELFPRSSRARRAWSTR
jgi:phage terminase large subunit-like protein